MFFCKELQLVGGDHGEALSPAAGAGPGPNTTWCMMRPGTSVNAPAMTRAPRKREIMARRCSATRWRCAAHTASGRGISVKIDSRGIGLHGPHSRIWWIRNELSATASMRPTKIQPMVRWGMVPFGAANCTMPSAKAAIAAMAWSAIGGGASSNGARVMGAHDVAVNVNYFYIMLEPWGRQGLAAAGRQRGVFFVGEARALCR